MLHNASHRDRVAKNCGTNSGASAAVASVCDNMRDVDVAVVVAAAGIACAGIADTANERRGGAAAADCDRRSCSARIAARAEFWRASWNAVNKRYQTAPVSETPLLRARPQP
jgi:hypothetical protein